MNEIEDRLAAAVRAEAGFGADEVGARVTRRRRRRRAASAVAALALVAGVGVGVASLAGDDPPDLAVAGDDGGDDGSDDGGDDGATDGGDPDPVDDGAPIDEVLEDPVGADGSIGVTSTDHLVAESPFALCDTVPRDGPAEGERYAAQEAMWQAFSAQFTSAEWPFVAGFGSPESIWGMPTVDLTRPDQDTFDRLLEFFEPGEMCVGLPSAGEVPPVPVDLPWELVSVSADDTSVTVVELTSCATKAHHVDTWVLEFDGRVEVGIQAWSEANAGFNDDCPPPAEYTVDLPSPLAGRDLVVATARPLEIEGPVAAGSTATFTVSDANRDGIGLIGDDLLARLVDDPTVRFQVSDVFADPIAGRPRAVARDQHPMTGAGTIRVPADVPAGTYTIQFLDHPELNGTLVVDDAVPIPDPSEPVDPPNGVLVADGEVSDIHVEAFDIALPECTEDQLFGDAPDNRRAELSDRRDELQAEGLFDQPFLSTTSVGSVIEIGLNRRYGPTIDWIGDRVAPEDVCLLFYPPPGVFTAPPEVGDWLVAESATGASELTIRLDQACGLVETSMLSPAVVETDDEVLITWVASPYFGPSRLPCLPPDEAHFLLDAPLGDRQVRAAEPRTVVAEAGQIVEVAVARVVTDTLTGLGDDVMIQSVDDPSVQIQVTGVWGDPTAGPPAPIVTDRYAPADTASLHVPAGTPPGDYTWIFIEHPQLNGTITITD